MRCIQPYISQVEKLTRQILRSHSSGLGNLNLSQQIASKYNSFKLGRFPLATLMLQQTNFENTIANTIQIFKHRVINVLPAANQLRINLNFLCYANVPIQKLRENVLTLSKSNSLTIAQSSQISSDRLVSIMGLNAIRWFNRDSLSNIHVTFLSSKVKVGEESQTASLAHPQSRLARKTQLRKTHPNRLLSFVRQDDRDGTNYAFPQPNAELKLNYSALSGNYGDRSVNLFANNSDRNAYSKDNRLMSLVPINSDRKVEDFARKNSDRHWTPDISAKLTKTQTSLLFDAVTTNWNISTFERKFDLWTKKDNLQLPPGFKTQKIAFDSSNELRMASHRQIRTRRFNQLANELMSKRVTAASIHQQKYYSFSQTTAMELAQSPPVAIKPTSTIQQSQKEFKKGWQPAKSANINTRNIDVNGIAERVFQVIERKLKTERQRRGIL